MWFESMINNYFIVVFEDDSFSVKNEKEISRMYDMQDCNEMDEVVGIYKIKDGKFYAVKSREGSFRKINTDEECPFRYGQSDLVIQRLGREEVVATVTLTDH